MYWYATFYYYEALEKETAISPKESDQIGYLVKYVKKQVLEYNIFKTAYSNILKDDGYAEKMPLPPCFSSYDEFYRRFKRLYKSREDSFTKQDSAQKKIFIKLNMKSDPPKTGKFDNSIRRRKRRKYVEE